MTVAQANVTIVATNRALPAFGDVVVEADVQKRSGPDGDIFGFGVACRVQDARNFYLLAINGNGLYGIVRVRDGLVVQLKVSQGIPDPGHPCG